MAQESQLPRVIRFGIFEVDVHSGELRRSGVKLKLQEQPLQVLCVLLEHPGEVVTREDLHSRLWSVDTYVDFDHGLNAAVKRLRDALGDSAENPRFVETVARRGYRFIAPVRPLQDASETEFSPGVEVQSASAVANRTGWRWKSVVAAGVVVFALSTGGYYYSLHRSKLTYTDTIVLTDFANSTGEMVFDDALKTGLSVSLRQSPYLNVLSDDRIAATLRQMTRPADAKLTPEVARELCQRTGSKAYIVGSIASLGSEYVLGLKAVNCQSGGTLAQDQVTASAKEQVLSALGEASSKLRGELGESLATVQKFDVPVEATTSSLEALKLYSLGVRAQGDAESLPYFKRAVERDPDFALAYAAMGRVYRVFHEDRLRIECITRAYELRNRVSEREKWRLSVDYYTLVTDEVDKAIQAADAWAQSYPRDPGAHQGLANAYRHLGQFDKALAQYEVALRLDPNDGSSYGLVALMYMHLNRLDAANTILQQARARKLDHSFLHGDLYDLAFLKGDTAGMQQQVEWAAGRPGDEAYFLNMQSDTEAYYGRLEKAREFSRRAVQLAIRADFKRYGRALAGAGRFTTGDVWQLPSNKAGRGCRFGPLAGWVGHFYLS